jgi:hydroxymethylbilane synthase
MKLRIGTRGSKLALAQSNLIKENLINRYPDLPVELIIIKTKGDKILESPLAKIGGKGLFVKEIEEALLEKRIDLAVHSIKDVPAELPEGLHIPVFPEREDPRDVFLSLDYGGIEDLPSGSPVGTGSLRRASQVLNIRQDLEIVPIRGNVDTRVKRLESGELKAIILAAAGLKRLGLFAEISHFLPIHDFLPAIGQGALGLEIRRKDEKIHELISFLNDKKTELTVKAERAFLLKLEGGCQVPIAGHAELDGKDIVLEGMVAELGGSRIIRDRIKGNMDKPEKLGTMLAEKLLDSGADKILDRIYSGVVT